MAVEPATEATDSDHIQTHVRDYSKFIGMLKWSAIGCFIIAMAVILIIRN